MERVTRRWLVKAGVLLPLTSVLGSLVGCEPPDPKPTYRAQEEVLRVRGISGEHPLLDLGSLRGWQVDGTSGGNFVGFVGSVSGGDMSRVQFAWTTTNKDPLTVITEIPTTRAIFRIKIDQPQPTASFDIDVSKLVYYYYEYKTRDFENPNDFLNPTYLQAVRFILSPEQFQKIPANLQR